MDRENDRKMVWLRLEDEEQRREVLRKKSRLRGRKERIIEDWTWEERSMRSGCWKRLRGGRRE